MYEVYVRCPATGEPFYAGVQEENWQGADLPSFLQNSICPVCGVKHEWRASSVVLELPLTGPDNESAVPQLQQSAISDLPADEWVFERAVGAE